MTIIKSLLTESRIPFLRYFRVLFVSLLPKPHVSTKPSAAVNALIASLQLKNTSILGLALIFSDSVDDGSQPKEESNRPRETTNSEASSQLKVESIVLIAEVIVAIHSAQHYSRELPR